MVRIRLAHCEDARQISQLGKTTFKETFGDLFQDSRDLKNYLNETFSVNKIEKSLQKSNNVYWIAVQDELPVGYAKLKLKSPSEFIASGNVSQLQKIYVLKDFISLKIGRRLQDALLAEAKEKGCEEIWLSVWKGNERAIGFYQKNDFRLVGSHQFSIGKETFNFIALSKRLKN